MPDLASLDALRETVIALIAALGGPAAAIGAIRSITRYRGTVLNKLDGIETSIRRIDANLRAQANLDPRPMLFTNEKGLVTFVNRAFSRSLGWSPEDMLGMGWVNAIQASDRQRARDEWLHGVTDKRPFFIPRVLLAHRDGDEVPPARLEADVMKCHDGSNYGWQCILHLSE